MVRAVRAWLVACVRPEDGTEGNRDLNLIVAGCHRRYQQLKGFHTDQPLHDSNVAVCQNLVPLVNIKIAGKWMFIPLKMVLIGIDPYPCECGNDVFSTARWNFRLSKRTITQCHGGQVINVPAIGSKWVDSWMCSWSFFTSRTMWGPQDS